MYRKLQLTILVSMMCMSVFGQAGKTSLAQTQFDLGAFEACIVSATEGLKHDPQNLQLMQCIARSNVQLNRLEEGDEWYKRILEFTASKEISLPQLSLEYGHLLRKMGRIDEATKYYHDYASYDRETGLHFASACGKASEILKADREWDVYLTGMNSAQDDYGVQMTKKGFVICTFRTDVCQAYPEVGTELIHFLQVNSLDESLALAEIKPLNFNCSAPVNPVLITAGPEANTWVLSTGTFQDGVNPVNTSNTGMKIFTLKSEVGNPVELTAFPYNAIGYSTGFANLSADGTILYFASNMPGGFGGFDLYYCTYTNGTWTTPVNLGKEINSEGNELSPFIHGNKLYFASDYHPGLGGFDIFKTEISNGIWTKVENMGKGINSFLDDMYPAVQADKDDFFFFASNRSGGPGGFDIYKATPHIPVLEPTIVYNEIPPAILLSDLNVRPSQTEFTDKVLAMEEETTVILDSEISNNEAIPSQIESVSSLSSGVVSNYFSLSNARKVTVNDTSPEKVYFIQVAAFTKSHINMKSFSHLRNYGNVYRVQKANSTKLRVGYYTDAQEAAQVLDQVRSAGYNDAFIVMEPLLTNELELIVSGDNIHQGSSIPDPLKNNVVRPSKVSNYKIRLASYTDPLWFDTERVKDLGEIEQWTKGNYTIFILSGYADLEAAQRAMLSAKNRGFSDAHIVVDNNGFLEKLKEN